MTSVKMKFDPFLERMGLKERAKMEKHLAACDAEESPTHGQLWRRLAALLGELAPLAVQSVGNNAWRFFIADGKYRMQVFALEDSMDGLVRVYLTDVLSEAVKAKIVARTPTPQMYAVEGSDVPLKIESLGAAEASSALPHFEHMLGWNRKALRLTLSTAKPDEKVFNAVQSLLQLAAKKFEPAVTAAVR